MKTVTSQAAIAAALLLASTTVSAGEDTYANAQIAIPSIAGYSGGLAVVATYGMPMKKLLKNAKDDIVQKLMFEGEFTSTLLSKPSYNYNYGFGVTGSIEMNYNTFAGYAVYNHTVSPELTLRGRAGLLLATGDVSSDFGISYGFGGVYKLAGDMDAIFEYTQITTGISHISGGVQFKF